MEIIPWRYKGIGDKSYHSMIGQVLRYIRFSAIPFIIVVFFLFSDCYSQTIKGSLNENIYRARTKQFNEFIDRFNYRRDFNGNPIDSAFRAKMPREKFVNSIFDFKDSRISQGAESFSEEYVNLKSQFIKDIVVNNRRISKYSSNIIAEARSKVLINGIPGSIILFLRQEIVENSGVKWVIIDAAGEFTDFLKTDTTFIRFIPPGSNETDFINLKRGLEDIDYLQYYASSDFKIDRLSIFFYCVNTRMISFEYVEEIVYHILDIPGWCIKVKEFNRNELNSGWLISDIRPNHLNIIDYLNSLHQH